MASLVDEILEVSKLLEQDDEEFESMNAQLDKQVAEDMEKIETYVIPDSPTSDPKMDPDEEEDKFYQSMNAELDKQVAKDMEAIKKYVDQKNDSLSKRIEFFNNMDSSHMSKCVDKAVSNHILVQHTISGTIKWHECTQCEYRAKDKEKLREHMTKHSLPIIFLCPRCSLKLKTKEALLKHLKVVHGENKVKDFQCDKCGADFTKYFDMLRHTKSQHGADAFPCQKCDFVCVEESELTQHLLAEHTKLNVSWYKCAQCSYRTGKKVNLDRHVMYKHSLY